MNKFILAALSLSLFASCGKEPKGEEVENFGNIAYVNYAQKGMESHILRGRIIEPAVESEDTKQLMGYIEDDKELGLGISILPKDLNQYNQGYKSRKTFSDYSPNNPAYFESKYFANYFRSYRSKKNGFGSKGEAEEFSADGNGGVAVHVNSAYLDLCCSVLESDMELVIQMSGVPVEGQDDGSVKHLFRYSPTREYHESARFYPFPHPDDREASGNAIADYAVELVDQICDRLGEEYRDKVIFCGNQEPSHTPGYYAGNQTDHGSDLNIEEYPQVWKPTAQRLKEVGIRSGVSQLNQASDGYPLSIYSVATNKVPHDFYTLQQYKGFKNDICLPIARKNLDYYGLGTAKKVLLNRYDINDGSEAMGADRQYNSAEGMIYYLTAEKVLLENADMVYGYNLMVASRNKGRKYAMMDFILETLVDAPTTLRTLNFDAYNGLVGFALCSDSETTLFFWNTSKFTHNVELAIKKSAQQFTQVDITRFDGTNMTSDNDSASSWDVESQSFSSIEVGYQQLFVVKLK